MADIELNRILHVDDESDIRQVARLALETVGGFTVEGCASGREALEKGPRFAPQLILLDVMMPGLDGPATFEAMKEIDGLREVPVVFVTAKAMPSELRRFLDMGAAGVIAKPFDPMAISGQLREIWRQAVSDPEAKFAEKFEALRKAYAGRLDERLKEMEGQRDALASASGSDGETVERISRAAHKLAGNAATFGFAELGDAAAQLETVCEGAGKDGALPDSIRQEIVDRVGALRALIG
ncbi:MAG: response regulator [Rhodospirillales bacterium]|nr:response regulator [Rhodospirillales bacterium]